MVWSYIARRSAVFLVAAIGQVAFSYPTPVDFDGGLLRWENPEAVTYEIEDYDPAESTYLGELVDMAATRWSHLESSGLVLKKAGEDEKANITIQFVERGTDDGATAGFAVFDEVNDDGPQHCAIKVILEANTSLTLAKTILHELGHCVGLGHSLVPEAIMSYRLDRNSFSLNVDDLAAISRLYPKGGEKAKMPKGCAVSPRAAKADDSSAVWLLLMPLILSLACWLVWNPARFQQSGE